MPIFRPVNELERLLLQAAMDPVARPDFYRALPEHELLIITHGRKSETVERVTLKDEPIEIRMLEYDGDLFAPIFSSVDRISEIVAEDVGYLSMKGRDLLLMLRGKNLILNPGADCGRTFGSQEVESLLDGSMFEEVDSPEMAVDAELGQPDEYPQGLIDALTRFLAKRKEVNAAYLGQSSSPTGKQPRLLIGFDVSGNAQQVIADATSIIEGGVADGQVVDFVQMTGNADDKVSVYLRQQTPFYKRKKWLGLF